VYALAAWGIFAAWREPETGRCGRCRRCGGCGQCSQSTSSRGAVVLLVSLVLYFIAVSGPEAYARFRVPVMPLLAVLAGRGAVRTAQT
jgi:hypothetical protein